MEEEEKMIRTSQIIKKDIDKRIVEIGQSKETLKSYLKTQATHPNEKVYNIAILSKTSATEIHTKEEWEKKGIKVKEGEKPLEYYADSFKIVTAIEGPIKGMRIQENIFEKQEMYDISQTNAKISTEKAFLKADAKTIEIIDEVLKRTNPLEFTMSKEAKELQEGLVRLLYNEKLGISTVASLERMNELAKGMSPKDLKFVLESQRVKVVAIEKEIKERNLVKQITPKELVKEIIAEMGKDHFRKQEKERIIEYAQSTDKPNTVKEYAKKILEEQRESARIKFAEKVITDLESNRSFFGNKEKNYIVNFALNTDSDEKVKQFAKELAEDRFELTHGYASDITEVRFKNGITRQEYGHWKELGKEIGKELSKEDIAIFEKDREERLVKKIKEEQQREIDNTVKKYKEVGEDKYLSNDKQYEQIRGEKLEHILQCGVEREQQALAFIKEKAKENPDKDNIEKLLNYLKGEVEKGNIVLKKDEQQMLKQAEIIVNSVERDTIKEVFRNSGLDLDSKQAEEIRKLNGADEMKHSMESLQQYKGNTPEKADEIIRNITAKIKLIKIR